MRGRDGEDDGVVNDVMLVILEEIGEFWIKWRRR